MSQETKPLPAPHYQESEPVPSPLVTLVCIGIVLTWILIFIVGMAISHGGWAAWWSIIGLGVCAAVILGVLQINTHWKAHQLHTQELKNQEHHRRMTQFAIANDHSARHISATSSFETISKYMGPASHTTIKDVTLGNEQQELLPAPLPGPLDLAHLLERWRPDGRNIFLGLGPGGEFIIVPIKSLCHVALAGATGGGKSTLMRLLLPQLVDSGCKVMLADPHYTPYDHATGEDWRPIASRLAVEPAVSYEDINDMLTMLAYHELKKRLDLRHAGKLFGDPVFLCMDELPSIVDNVKGATDALKKLLREGRKVDIFLVSAATDWLVKTLNLGGSGGVRDCFRTAFYVGGDTTSARVLLDVQGRVDDGGLGKGIAMLRSKATPQASLVRVPSVSNEALYELLPTSTPLQSHYEATSIDEVIPDKESVVIPALDVRSQRIKELLLARSKPKKIIEEVWHTSGGSTYVKASDELAEIIAQLIERGEV